MPNDDTDTNLLNMLNEKIDLQSQVNLATEKMINACVVLCVCVDKEKTEHINTYKLSNVKSNTNK